MKIQNTSAQTSPQEITSRKRGYAEKSETTRAARKSESGAAISRQTHFIDQAKVLQAVDVQTLMLDDKMERLNRSSPGLREELNKAISDLFSAREYRGLREIFPALIRVKRTKQLSFFFCCQGPDEPVYCRAIALFLRADEDDRKNFLDNFGLSFLVSIVSRGTKEQLESCIAADSEGIRVVVKNAPEKLFELGCDNIGIIDTLLACVPRHLWGSLPGTDGGRPLIKLVEAEKEAAVTRLLQSMSCEQSRNLICKVGILGLQVRKHPFLRPIMEKALVRAGITRKITFNNLAGSTGL